MPFEDSEHSWVHYSIAAAEIVILVLATLRRSPADMSCEGKREGRVRASRPSCFSLEQWDPMNLSVCCRLRRAPHALPCPREANAAGTRESREGLRG